MLYNIIYNISTKKDKRGKRNDKTNKKNITERG